MKYRLLKMTTSRLVLKVVRIILAYTFFVAGIWTALSLDAKSTPQIVANRALSEVLYFDGIF